MSSENKRPFTVTIKIIEMNSMGQKAFWGHPWAKKLTKIFKRPQSFLKSFNGRRALKCFLKTEEALKFFQRRRIVYITSMNCRPLLRLLRKVCEIKILKESLNSKRIFWWSFMKRRHFIKLLWSDAYLQGSSKDRKL